MNKKINLKVYGKWILAGEYSVLKSHPALAFPLFSQFIELNYQEENSTLQINEDAHSDSLSTPKNTSDPPEQSNFISFFKSVLDQAFLNISKNHSHLKGTITLKPHISFGSGMGASAVVCVLIGRLFHHLKWLKKEELFPFCHSLENTLHGQSSGVDIATVLTGKPILFSTTTPDEEHTSWIPAFKGLKALKGLSGIGITKKLPNQINITPKKIQVFHPRWQAPVFLSHSGKSSSTKINIKKIKQFWDEEPQKANALNQLMTQAVLKAKEGLEMENEKKGLTLLIKSFSLAEECFSKWNLISPDMKEHISFLKKQGALATKPTGSGAGGCVISLWPKSPPSLLSNQLISAF